MALHGIGTPSGDPVPMSADGKAALEGANAQALRLGHTTIDPAHLLLALIEAGGGGPRAARGRRDSQRGARARQRRRPGRCVRPRASRDDGPRRPIWPTCAPAIRSRCGSAPTPTRSATSAIRRSTRTCSSCILVNDTIVAQLLREHGIDERLLRETFGLRRPARLSARRRYPSTVA